MAQEKSRIFFQKNYPFPTLDENFAPISQRFYRRAWLHFSAAIKARSNSKVNVTDNKTKMKAVN